MKQIVIMPGGFHPFHAGHMALYNSAKEAFPSADVYVAATDSREERPFPFAVKEKLAKVAGVDPGRFIQVKSPFKPNEITDHYDPEEDVLIFVRSEKDRNESPKPGGIKKDGSPSYFQPWTGKNLQPFSQHAYMAYLPTVIFGPGIKSATEIRNSWPNLNDRQKTAMVMSLYPATQKNQRLAKNVVGMLDQVMGGTENVTEDSGEVVDFPIANVRRPNGAIGTQGVTTDQVAGVLKNVVGLNVSGDMSMRELVDSLRTNPQAQQRLRQFTKQNPIKVQELPDGTYHLEDGHHRTFLLNLLGDETVPAVVQNESIREDTKPNLSKIIFDFYKPIVKDVHKEKLPDYVEQARELMHKADPDTKQKLLDIFKKGKENPYLQGGIITTVGALLAGGVLNSAQTMGLSPQQTNLALQGILNTVIPTLVSRINGKNWIDTIKYTLASAGVGTGIAAITEDQDYLEEK